MVAERKKILRSIQLRSVLLSRINLLLLSFKPHALSHSLSVSHSNRLRQGPESATVVFLGLSLWGSGSRIQSCSALASARVPQVRTCAPAPNQSACTVRLRVSARVSRTRCKARCIDFVGVRTCTPGHLCARRGGSGGGGLGC